jgi:competence protein ComEC
VTPARLSATFLSAFIATIFCLQWWQRAQYPFELWLGLFILLALSMIGSLEEGIRPLMVWLCAAAIGVLLAFGAVTRTTHMPTRGTVDWYARGWNAVVRGIIAENVDRRATSTRITVKAGMIRINGTGAWLPVHGRLLATVLAPWPEPKYGDAVIVRGILKRPELIEEPALRRGEGFRYDRYLSLSGIYAVMPMARLELEGGNEGNPIIAVLYRTKERFEARLGLLLPEPEASFAAGLLTGSRRGMPTHVTESFKACGLTHIVAISGMNITIVLTLILGLLFWLPLRWRFLPAVLAIVAFTILVGASASVIRAAIMGILGLLAMTLGRQRDARFAILWTAFLMLLWNPKLLWYDAGFQLSFAAVIGLMELGPLIRPFLRRMPEILGIREALEATICAQLAAVPVGLLAFKTFSLISPLANILTVPLIPLAMLLSALSVVVSPLSLLLGRLVAIGAWAVLHWIVLVAETLARIPFASLQFQHVSIALIILYYVALTLIVLRWNQTNKRLQPPPTP